MPLYEVLEGCTYTVGDRVYQAGELVDLLEGQASPWFDLLLSRAKEQAPEPQQAPEPKKEKVTANV